ncbi:T9SS type B sorting domain-containing protein [Flagellimonas zhangzhouensis]|uniref:Conserved repeat domain-containing protein/gliding motility-associated C-terminal domain-containing protein n=2 Tax=Flagellimonas zhangzhouensis TaxID=1073328 RepID=A0A1H2U0R0_9FLAO|nr:gliding motility-associated C-terminal domain-containing protein [Allomuricauda zhangzhouensis]SDQ21560.1 conserved repeat domain-containing protein/gliding motility-associated C-terminal domain-containing protein [Allomuricauda zhangzhouensis]SDW49558.1 conserved repeat domain-containing protein/gliding motility-associated C-terminal domain-containing protein [Allomuricauda zhangzhouensis]
MNKTPSQVFLYFLLFLITSLQMGYSQSCAVDAGSDQVFTQVSSVSLNAATPAVGTGVWSQVSGPTTVIFDDANDPTTGVGNTTFGTYFFEWTVSDATCDTNSDTVAISVQGIDLELEVLASNTVPEIGDVVTFTINLSNLGDVDATGVSVQNLVPIGYDNITAINNSGASYPSPDRVVWTGISVPVGSKTASLSFNATVQTPTSTSGEYTHIAEVVLADQDDFDSTPDNDDGDQSEDDEDTVTAAPLQSDLSLTKSVVGGNLAPYVGQQISFEISVTNDGPHDATNVRVVDQLLSGFSFVSSSATSGTYNSTSGFWEVGTVANGDTETLTINVTVNSSGNHTNTSQIIASDAYDSDSTPANGVSSEDDQGDLVVVPSPVIDLSLTKTIDKSPPLVSDNVRFTITVTNDGPSTATSVEVTDQLPSGYTYVSDNAGGAYNQATGIWNVGTIPSGSSRSLSILCNVNPSGDYNNTAQITGHDQTDIDSSPNNDAPGEDDQDQVNVYPDPLVDISVTKMVDEFIPEVGSEIVFTVNVTNDGPSDATNVVVTDMLASGYDLVSISATSGTYNSINGSWVVGNLASGNTETLEITVEVLPTGNYSNTAELTNLTELDVDSTPGNNNEFEDDQQTISTIPIPVADLLLRKSVNVLSPFVGQEVIFTLNVTNFGPSDATGVEVMDLLPDGYTYVSHSSTSGNYNNATGLWVLGGPLPDGNTETLNIVAEVNNSGDYFNVTEVYASDQIDPNSTPNNNNIFENDQDNAGTTPIPSADLAVEVSVDNETPDVGTQVIFKVTLINEGPSDAIGVRLRNNLPNGYTYISDDGAGRFNPNSGIWNVGTIGLNSQMELNIVAEVNADGDYTNVAEVTDAIFFDPDSTPNNNVLSEDDQDAQVTTPRHVTDIEVVKSVDNLTPNVGMEVVFTIEVTNQGPNDASGLVIEDVLQTGFQFISSTATSGSYDVLAGSWGISELNNGVTETLEITALVLADGIHTNKAELIALATFDPDSTPNNNLASEDDQDAVTLEPFGSNDLSLEKIVDNPEPNVGDVVRFLVSVTNHGLSGTSGVEVTDILPTGYTYQSHTTTAGVYNPNTGIWDVNRSIPSQDTESLEVLAMVNPPTDTPEEYLNVAFISASKYADPDSDPNVGIEEDDLFDGLEDDDEATAFVEPQTTDISIGKTVDNTSPRIGDEVVFSITATNQGEESATNLSIEELLPLGYRYVSHSATIGTYDPSGLWEIEELMSSETATLELTVQILDIEDYLNVAQLTYVDQWDTDETNNRADAFVNPTCLLVYNEFSPNGDGVNDTFRIDCLSRYPNNTLEVFNRWGTMVHHAKNYKNDWDGTADGQKGDGLPAGTYYYVLDLGDGSEPQTDWLYINR